MRTDLFRRAACRNQDVQTIVVPVAGALPAGVARSPEVIVVSADPARARAGARALIGERVWRDRLTRAGALPRRARAASPGLAETVSQAMTGSRLVAVHVMRSYLAPLGIAVAERVQATRLTLDLDEDDAGLARVHGDDEEAAAYERLVGVFGPLFDGLSAASAGEAEALGERHGLGVDHVPNAVELHPETAPRRCPDGHRGPTLLFVGNLTYPPNVEAARVLVEEVMPLVQHRVQSRVHVTLVGPHHPALERLARPGVELAGFVSELGPVYGSADAVVVPLRSGAGTRIKLLEAFAYGVPVVASPAAAAGLDVSHGRHLLLAEDADQLAAAIVTILADKTLAARLAEGARRLVRSHYSTESVMPVIRKFFSRAVERSGSGLQPSGEP
jgi:glycosyltransferase involved in cell wall biosynthesis